ncbi:MAG: hypothetical protein JO250_07690 [Armatimonadetes bacterium]|nr:hypothetical protein [Armatimonadota bacterium]
MPHETGTRAGTGGTAAQDSNALPNDDSVIGHVEPIIGRVAQRDVQAYFGFPLIRKGETVTRETAERAQNLGRLFELIAATEEP